jgi:uncharacterized protein (DUF1501 family)
MKSSNALNRRSFIRQAACAAVGTFGLTNALFDLRRIAAATMNNSSILTSDYKALVCLFLFGGNDANNMVVPSDTTDYNSYVASRGILALPAAGQPGGILPINLIPGHGTDDGRTFGFHPNFTDYASPNGVLPGLQSLFNGGNLAVLGNVGTLIYPTTKTDFQTNPGILPPQLFSHSDQQVEWQTSIPQTVNSTGWGGRVADLLNSSLGSTQISTCISLNGTNTFEVGASVVPYSVSPSGAIALNGYTAGSAAGTPSYAVDQLIAASHVNLFEKTIAATTKRALDNNLLLAAALSQTDPAAAPYSSFDSASSLASQLKMVARLIAAAQNSASGLNPKRQIFFVSVGGYDTHGDQLNAQNNLYTELNNSLSAFYAATSQLGVANNVTAFTSSDFGRTFQTNGAGSDHGWGSHHLVLGGAVQGGGIYGRIPVLQAGGPDDASNGSSGQGRWIPSVSVDEYAATLATWFGVSPTDLATALPNIGNFANPNLGFI